MRTLTLDATGLCRPSSAVALATYLARQPGVHHAAANPAGASVTVGFDEALTTEAAIAGWIRDFGCGSAGQAVPTAYRSAETGAVDEYAGHAMPAAGEMAGMDPAAMDHGGMDHGGMSMAEAVLDMRRRFFVTLALLVPVMLYSPMGPHMLGLMLPTPFGLSPNVIAFVLATIAVFYGGKFFFVGAWNALRHRVLDMSVLIALSVGAGYLFSVAATFIFQADVFYEAVVMLLAFVLFGHWMEMRARAGTNDAMRALLDLAPPTANIERDGQPLTLPTAQVLVGDIVLIRPGAAATVAALAERGVNVVMLTGDNRATAERIAGELGISRVLAEVLPGRKAEQVQALQAEGRRVAMVGDGINDAPALAQADVGIAIGTGTDVAMETADVVLMRSDPFDVVGAIALSRATRGKMRQNLAWAAGYNVVAMPIAAGLLYPSFGLLLRPEIAALAMSGSSLLVAVNALLLKRARLPSLP